MLKPGSIILFQGDSITDTHRDREVSQPNNISALGTGYANQIASTLLRQYPTHGLQFYNRGIGGNRVVDLDERWQVDAVNLRPTAISILIGVNDAWHAFSSNKGVDVGRYAEVYRRILEYTRQQLPAVHLILCEPFVLSCGLVKPALQGEMPQLQQIVKTLAADFNADFVPFQSQFDTVANTPSPEYWLHDGIHPTPAGHRLMAECWLQSVKAGN